MRASAANLLNRLLLPPLPDVEELLLEVLDLALHAPVSGDHRRLERGIERQHLLLDLAEAGGPLRPLLLEHVAELLRKDGAERLADHDLDVPGQRLPREVE